MAKVRVVGLHGKGYGPSHLPDGASCNLRADSHNGAPAAACRQADASRDPLSRETTPWPTKKPPSTDDQPQQQRGPQVIIDDRDLQYVYANAYRVHAADEVVIDLGYNMPNPNPNPQQQQSGVPQVLYKGSHRVIMSYANAKRLAGSLVALVKRYEQQFGEIKLPQAQAPAGPVQ